MNTHFYVDIESIACPLGCAAGDDVVLTGYDRLNNLPGEFTVVKCATCGLMRTDPRPKPRSMGFYYPDGYGPYQSTRVNHAELSNTNISAWKRKLLNMFQFNSRCLPSVPVGRMLEVGCAYGVSTIPALEAGAHITGADPYGPGREALALTGRIRPKPPLLRTVSRLGRLGLTPSTRRKED